MSAKLNFAIMHFVTPTRIILLAHMRVSELTSQNQSTSSWHIATLSQCYRRDELEKKRSYDQRIREIEHRSFSPLVFSTPGGMGPTATTVYKKIASMMAQKQDKPYSKTLHWIRCKLSFSLLPSAIMCLRGARSNIHQPVIWELGCDLPRGPGPSAVAKYRCKD